MNKSNESTEPAKSKIFNEIPFKGAEAPPRHNGELLFEAPWEARAFAMGVALHEQGLFQWQEFQQQLIASIEQWEASNDATAEYPYYERWLNALQNLLKKKGICTVSELESCIDQLNKRPVEHDHI